MAVEEPDYTMLKQAEDFELRRYERQLVAETWVSGDQRQASNEGFKILADYIFGNNTAPSGGNRKISMTAPVNLQQQNADNGSIKIAMIAPVNVQQSNGKWRVRFVMPSQYTTDSLPKPNNPEVSIIEIAAQTYGVIKFSGLTSSPKVNKKTEALKTWMQNQNLTLVGQPELARYNPPWTLPFMRRNEILIRYEE